MEKYDEYGKGTEQALRIDLHQNFRSRVEVLDSVNALFYRLMGKALGGIVYDEQAALYRVRSIRLRMPAFRLARLPRM